MPETMRERVERVYRFACMDWPMAIELAKPETAQNPPKLTQRQWVELSVAMGLSLIHI